MTLKHLRSSTANKRPQPSGMVDGQLAINTASGSPGLFFKDSAGSLVKVGPVHVGTTAPNASVASGGASGNTIGEQWLDTTGGVYALKIWDGAAWRSEDGTFVNTTGDTMTGSLTMGSGTTIIFEGATDDGFETTLTVADPTADNVVTLPNVTGTVITTGDTGTVTSAMIADGTIVNGDINASAAIALSKLATGALPTGITISSGNIVDGTITNADVNASAAIAGTKIAPNFGTQDIQTTGDVYAGSGTVSLPAFSFAGDTDSGFYNSAANEISAATSGVVRLKIGSTGTLVVGDGIGGGPLALQLNKDYTGGADGSYIQANTTIKSDVVTSARIFRSIPSTDAAAFTLTNLVHFTANPGSFGSGSTVTNQYGFLASSTMSGATNNYGFRSEVPTGANNYAFYASSTADSQFNSTNFIFSPLGTERMRVNSAGYLLIGTSSNRPNRLGATAYNSQLQMESEGGSVTAGFSISRFVDSTSPAFFNMQKGRGTIASPSGVIAGDVLGSFVFSAYESGVTTWVNGAAMQAVVDGTVASGSVPSRLVFQTNGGTGLATTERMRITSSGQVLIATTSAGNNADLQLNNTNNNWGNTSRVISAFATFGSGVQFANGVATSLSTAGAGIITDAYHFSANQGTFSTVPTNQIGFIVGSGLTGATNNYSFYGNIPAGTGRWNFYAGGTADNYFAGKVLIGTTTAFGVSSSTASDFEIETTGISASFVRNSADAIGSILALGKSRGTTDGSVTIVASGDALGEIRFAGADGSTRSPYGALIRAVVDGTPASGNMPARLVLYTASGGASPVERMRITSAGYVGIGTTVPNAGLEINSAASTAPLIAGIASSEVARIDSNGYLLIGKSSTASYGTITGKLQITGTSDAHIALKRSSADASQPIFVFAKSRGTDASPTIVSNNDTLGECRFAAHDGASYNNAGASISASIDGTPASGIVPGRISLSTTDGTGAANTQWRVTSDGMICYAQPAPATVNTSSTLTIANLKTGIISSTPASGVTLTLPSGGLVEAGFNSMFTNQAFEWSVINLSGTNAITIAAGTTHTITGSATVAANVSARYVTRRTASNTFVSYRLC